MTLDRNTAITWLGHATALIETPGGKRILLDPWTTGNPACPAEWKDPARLGRLDLILMTHLHNDHVGDVQAIARAHPEARIVGMVEATDWLEGKGIKNVNPMNKGGSQTVEGIRITMTHADHSSSFVQEDGSVVFGGEAAGYILQMENGFPLYAAGDTALFGDMALLRALYRPELALLPIGDLYTMGPREAVHAARLLGVAHVIPIHYHTFPALTGTPEAFAKYAADLPDLQIHVLQPGETLL
ncbi:MAG TPA: metal-dependent hydrolase [Chthonomonadaceae bacterium]|nr:metal-dependent hydrolase [Chthonomonadaceae bacterium]